MYCETIGLIARALLPFTILLMLTQPCLAVNLSSASLETRFNAALNRFPTYGDVTALGNASAGSPYSSSINPASSVWYAKEAEADLLLSPQLVSASFDGGFDIDTVVLASVVETQKFGSFQPVYANLDSNLFTTADGLELQFEADVFQTAWSWKPSDKWAYGFTFGFTNAETRSNLSGIPASESETESYQLTAGVLHGITERLFVGYLVSFVDSRTITDSFDIFGVGIGTTTTRVDDDILDFRIGMSYWFKNDWQVFADLQNVKFQNPAGDLTLNRLYAGLAIPFSESFYGRVGYIRDEDSNNTITAGIGIYPSDRVGFEFAYQQNAFPEIETEFGESDLVNLSAYFYF